MKRIKKIKECITHVAIHFRDYGRPQNPKYCVEVECTTHGSTWMGLSDDFTIAGEMAHAFPLVSGGVASGKDAFPIPDDCLLSKIPRKLAPQ